MKMNVWRRHSIVLLLVLCIGALACAALVYRALWVRYEGALHQLEPRSERLEGVVNAGSEIETLLSSASNTVAPLLHPAGEAAQNDIQQKIRQLIMASGSTLVSSQVALEPGGEGKLARIRLTATVSGEWAKLVNFMESLQTQRAPFWVRTANIMREGGSSGPGPQTARLTLQLEAPLAPEKVKP
ncbi:type II secretion system protein M [Acidovorax sp. sif1233]|uniref:GspMb/PilO family protein n=1 Tax=unclassified Acidovorax TaxID=2684926 RepID=UPI001C469F4A|nr:MULTISPECIES: GspMb/PilO family protein [unclassified Acidovorax]MBV7428773.1 type II secretion system protein M [Acidovorax sp. sif0732]MBV7450599.1 type II secretion system protein M [Acidovorax sp. sif0715]MBV7452984.1 type II secretion system protein M [Acidovorax sp. sif1233]